VDRGAPVPTAAVDVDRIGHAGLKSRIANDQNQLAC
jgi:hypothetical protein